MPSTPSSQPYWATRASSINTLSKDLALSSDNFGDSEAALSYDFQLFPEEDLSVSTLPTPPHAKKLAQDMIEIRKIQEGHQTTLPLQGSSRRQCFSTVDRLPPKPDSATVDMIEVGHGRRYSAKPYNTRSRRELSPRLPPKGPGGVQSLAVRHPGRQCRHTETQPQYNESDTEYPISYSPPPAPRIARLPTPDLEPVVLRPFCDCCTTPGPRTLCELCRKRQVQRDFDLLGVGMKFN